eukprot:6211807-Pleurochrysis_carterae.AAC.3
MPTRCLTSTPPQSACESRAGSPGWRGIATMGPVRGALWKSDEGGIGVGTERQDVRHDPNWGVSLVQEDGRRQGTSVSWVLQYVFRARRMCSAQELSGAPNDFAHDVIAVTDGRWSAVGGACSGIKTGYRESGARRRRKYGSVVAVGTAL